MPGHANAPVDYTDRTLYITPDGVQYMFSAPTFVLQEDGLGMPPIEYVTQRGPFQDGESVKNLFLRPRTLQMVVRRNGCSKAEYWNIRAVLLDILRPRRGTPPVTNLPGILRKYMANGAVREWEVFTTEGPSFPSHSTEVWDQWSVQDTIRFTAYNPLARDPKIQSRTYSLVGAASAVFPITFPYTFATFGAGADSVVVAGTWETFPTFTITGPLTAPFIRNVTTGEQMQFSFNLLAGQTAFVDLSYGNKTVTLNDGTSLLGLMDPTSDIGTFHLVSGTNVLQVFATGAAANSTIVMQWYNRYIGV